MDKIQILNAINSAIASLQQYQRNFEAIPSDLEDNYEDRAIMNGLDEFLRLTYIIRPEGTPCSRCKGTGVEK